MFQQRVKGFLLLTLTAGLFLITGCSEEEAVVLSNAPAEVDSDLTDARYNVLFRSDVLSAGVGDRSRTFDDRKSLLSQDAVRILEDAGVNDPQPEYIFVNSVRGVSVFLTTEEAQRLAGSPHISHLMKVRAMSIPRIVEPSPEDLGDDQEEIDLGQMRIQQARPWGVRRVGGAADGTGKTAWILDTGIDLDHPDLLVDTERAMSFIPNESPDDGFGHGSHVAGTVAAIDNNFGVVGVAAGATVVPVKVLSNLGSGSDAQVITGIDYVMENFSPGDVANMSLGGGASPILDQAVINAADAGVIFTIAAGNGNAFGIAEDAANVSPARVNHENVYTISAMNKIHGITIFSNYSASIIDYAAPGLRIASCYKNGGYRVFDGTSMAAPHVAGLLLSGGIDPIWQLLYDWDSNRDWIAFRAE